jgi:hypothetical protein
MTIQVLPLPPMALPLRDDAGGHTKLESSSGKERISGLSTAARAGSDDLRSSKYVQVNCANYVVDTEAERSDGDKQKKDCDLLPKADHEHDHTDH